VLIVLVLLAWGVFSWALVAQHRAYYSNAYDLGFFDQIIWNTAHGRLFETSFVPYNFAGQHMEPVLVLFAAAYRVWPNVELLLLTQAAVVAWAAVPLFVGACRLLRSRAAALLVAAAYLLAPHLHGAVLFDFHPEVMGTAGIFGAFALLAAGRPGWAIAALGSVLLLKEDAALAGLGFALIIWLRGYRRYALGLAAAAIAYLVLVVGVVMPAIRGGPGDLQERYGYLGDDAPGVITGALRHPDVMIGHLLGPGRREALAYLFGTQALLPVARPGGALAAAPLLAANLLATHPPQHQLIFHYVALPFALLLVTAVFGIERLAHSPWLDGVGRWGRISPARRAAVLAALLCGAQCTGYVFGSPLGGRLQPERYQRTPHTDAVDRVLRAVPAQVPLSAQSGLVPHLSQRRAVYEFPRLEHAEWVIIDRHGWRSSQANDAGYARVLAELPSLGYCLFLVNDGVEAYRKGACVGSRESGVGSREWMRACVLP
jgi:uncharacterized membrane protein